MFQDVIVRVRAEYLEMPGLRLKAEQVQRMCGIEQIVCQMVLEELIKTKFLWLRPDGHYTRLTEGQVSRPQAKADLKARKLSEAS